jgi:hypothetical protein
VRTEAAIEHVKFSITALDCELTRLTSPLAQIVGDEGLRFLESGTPSVRGIRAKIMLGRLQALRDLALTIKHDAAFWMTVTEMLNAPVEAEPLVETPDDTTIHNSPEAA